jgi:hypothetical protein
MNDCDMERGFIYYMPTVHSEEMGVSFQQCPALDMETAVRELEILKPEYPDCTFSVSRFAGEMHELPKLKRQHERLIDMMSFVETAERPGAALLDVIRQRQAVN